MNSDVITAVALAVPATISAVAALRATRTNRDIAHTIKEHLKPIAEKQDWLISMKTEEHRLMAERAEADRDYAHQAKHALANAHEGLRMRHELLERRHNHLEERVDAHVTAPGHTAA